MKYRLLAAMLMLALLLAALGGAAEQAPEDLSLEEAVPEVPVFDMEDPYGGESAPWTDAITDDGPEWSDGTKVPYEPAEADIPEAAEDAAEEGPSENIIAEKAEEAAEQDDVRPLEILPLATAAPGPQESGESVNPRDCQHPVTVAVVNRDARDIRYMDLHDGTHRISGTGVLVILCADCGMAVSRRDEYVEKCNYGAPDEHSATCQWCGHVKGDDGRHIHDFNGPARDFSGALLEAFPAEDAPEMYHICRFQKLRARKCTKCETYEDGAVVPGEIIETRENHVWTAGGQCALCDYVRTCTHDGEVIENAWTEDETYAFVNASVHEYAAVRYVQRCCATCGEPVGNVEIRRVTERQPHRFEDGRCADCGYVNVCDHIDMVYTYSVNPERATFEVVDSLHHEAVNDGDLYVSGEYCPDCGFAQTGLRLPVPAGQTAIFPHRFDADGICVDCGYAAEVPESACDHPEECRVALDPEDVDALKQNCRFAVDTTMSTESRHVLRVEYDPSWVCSRCGHREDLSDAMQVVTVAEPHRYYKGYCVTANCGYKCPHSQVVGDYAFGSAFYEYDGADGHYEVMPTVATGRCQLCGEYVVNHVVVKERGGLEAHVMVDGICRKCGYACPHPVEDIIQLLPNERTVYEFHDSAEHILRQERVTETICKACGYTLFEETEILDEYRLPHDFVDGVCMDCGYDPALDAAAADEEAFVSLTSDEVLNGVAVDDGLDLVETCVRVGDSLQAAVDDGRAAVEIENLSRIFTGDELARLEALSLREQLLAAQCFLGFRDAVFEAAGADTSLLGEDARVLIEDVQARIAAMSAADLDALSASLRAAFPLTPFEVVPGATTEVLSIDLRIATEDGISVDRYSFHDAGSRWRLIDISVGQEGSAR